MNNSRKKVGDDFLKVKDPMIGRTYHLAWAWRGAKWKLLRIFPDGKRCLVVTPKSGNIRTELISDLRETRARSI